MFILFLCLPIHKWKPSNEAPLSVCSLKDEVLVEIDMILPQRRCFLTSECATCITAPSFDLVYKMMQGTLDQSSLKMQHLCLWSRMSMT